ncbi:MAG: hypothetical protein CL686_03215 [Candidatus Nitrosopelagicus sp.]|jgi:hypothetical protein|nr:hypothetical protein [Candidatus Nitrosopelagicus sp.]|tara:strand:- start:1309 stop:1680 length:372 start_codon:yes stop_codon:yes gene_type:complete
MDMKMKNNLPANFLLYLRSGDLTISDGDGTAIEFTSRGDIRRINIARLPTKIPGKMGLIKQLTEAKHIGKVLKDGKVTLEILHKDKLVLKMGKNAKPKLSSILTLSKDIEIVDLKELRKLDKE